jgi:hypothetical protein
VDTSILLSFFFLIVNPWSILELRRSRSAGKERLKHAREELVTFLESHLIGTGYLTGAILYETATALAQKREVSVQDVYKPLASLNDVLLRLRANPVLEKEKRIGYESAIEDLIRELKLTEGSELIDDATAAVNRADKLNHKAQATRLLKQLAQDWATFEDKTLIARLARLSSRLGSPDDRALALELLRGLKTRWVGGMIVPR